MLEGVKLARKIGGNPALAQPELEIMPGAAVEDDQLAEVMMRRPSTQRTGHLAASRSSKSRRPAAAAAGSHNHRNQVTAAHLDGH